MVEFSCTIKNATGLHARPATQLAKLCQQYRSEITFRNDDRTFQGKSVVSILSGGFKKGTQLAILVSGPDETVAAEGIRKFF